MKGRKKIFLLFFVLIVILIIFILVSVLFMRKVHQNDNETVLTWEEILKKNKFKEKVSYFTVRLDEARNDTKLEEKYKNDYYIFDDEIMKQAIEILEIEQFQLVENLEEQQKILYYMQFTLEDGFGIRIAGSTDSSKKENCKIYPMTKDGWSIVLNSFFYDYTANENFFVSGNLSKFAEDVVLHQIKEITVGEAKKYISEGEQNHMVEKFFQHYYTTDGVTDMTASEVSELDRFELGDGDGYLVMERGVDNEKQGYYTVYCVTYYNKQDEIQEVLYKNQEAIDRKEK